MIDLPPHLAPWRAQLSIFPQEIALMLGSLISQLSNLLKDSVLMREAHGEPDGYDGIDRRGTYDRLLAHEWMLLDEMPDEFLRRVAFGEHAFLKRAHLDPGANKRCVVLFDAGIDQLGAPRIAQFATLILLAQRAQQQRATLAWGFFQNADRALHAELSEANVRDFFRSRSPLRVSTSDIQHWLDVLRPQNTSELWWVGAQEIAAHAESHRASSIVISDIVEPGGSQRVQLQARFSANSQVRESVLDMPKQHLAIRLIRNPFEAQVTARQATQTGKLNPHSNMIFSPNGRHLYVRAVDSRIFNFPVPNSPYSTIGKCVVFEPPVGHTFIAVGESDRRTVAVSQHEADLFLHFFSKKGPTIVRTLRFTSAHGYMVPEPEPQILRPLRVFRNEIAFFVDARGNVIELSNGNIHCKELASAFVSNSARHGFQWATNQHGVPAVKSVWDVDDFKTSDRELPKQLPRIHHPERLYFGREVFGVLAYASSPSTWAIVRGNFVDECGVYETWTVCGVIALSIGEPISLVALEESKKRIYLLTQGRAETIYEAESEIVQLVVSCDDLQSIAFLTGDGELGIFSPISKRLLLRTTGGAAL